MNLQKYADIYEKNSARFIGEWKDLLRIESISTDPKFEDKCRQAAAWLLSHLASIGMSAQLIETTGKPVVFAEKFVSKELQTLLFYGHYDVQPVDPSSLWTSEPFVPREYGGRLYARGAQDNKGQLFYFLKALESVSREGELGYNVKVIIEGEEECGSGGITGKLPELRDRLSSDLLLVCDTGTPDPRVGCITMGLRGIIHLEARLHGPSKDLHSGVHGGLIKNPAAELARIVTSLHDEQGRIAVPNFYDDVVELGPDDRRLANAFGFTDEWYKGQVGVLPTGGEKGVPPMERRGLRPTIEVNGIYGGYLGDGSKTIIPSHATVKISSRIVAKQDPKRVLESIIGFLHEQTPPEMRLEIMHAAAAGEALLVSSKAPVIQKARDILKEVTGGDPLLLWEGASIPLIPALIEASGSSPLLVGFGLEDDNIHAPNESFSLEQFRKGFLFCAGFLG